MTTDKRGVAVLQDPAINRGTAFTDRERDVLGLRGLLPPRVFTQDEQLARVMKNYRRKETDLERYIFLTALQDRNEKLFYRAVLEHIDEMMPVIYTPTVGEACKEFAHIFRRTRGLYISAADRGRVADILRNWPNDKVGVIVVTDGERILGLGDLGANGMGIPIGKLSLYTACAGIDPSLCLPVMLDVGTNNQDLRSDPLYLGLDQVRIRGRAYEELVDEFVMAVQEVFPGALIQFEDFITHNAYSILHRYRDRVLCFNDDIQGTAAVALAGLQAALRITRKSLPEQTILFLGAGAAATGIADLMVAAMVAEGLSRDQARRRIWLVDSKGLVVSSRRDTLSEHKKPYAHDHAPMDFLPAVTDLEPTALVGATGRPGTFTREIVELMAELNPRPIVFALSNPTSKAECTAEQAYGWSNGQVIFASGSPFAPVDINGRRYLTGQGNNAYIFPGIGLGAIVCGSSRITEDMFLAAARTLAEQVTEDRLDQGAIYPPLRDLRRVSVAIAVAVADSAYRDGLATQPRPDDLDAHIRGHVYNTEYDDLA
ncbi:MAG: NAD-dependent malic enzyme [Proteobacteria bacterium]|nr:NAD-dependent malic enzyme [Pseudomonadota bacterium]